MEVNNKFEILKEGNNVIIKHTILRTLNKQESLTELESLMGEVTKLEQQQQQLTESIEKELEQKNLETTEKQLKELVELKNSWAIVNNEFKIELKQQIKEKVKFEKAERGYERTEDNNKKIALQNIILTKVLSELGLNPRSQVARELTQEFIKEFEGI